MNLYSFVSITRHKFLSTCEIVVSKEFWRFFDAVRGFDINSAPESNRLFGGNGVCVYPLAFLHKPLRRLHYCRRGNSGFQHAAKSIWAILDSSTKANQLLRASRAYQNSKDGAEQLLSREANNPRNGAKQLLLEAYKPRNGAKKLPREAYKLRNGAIQLFLEAYKPRNGEKQVPREANKPSNGGKQVLLERNQPRNGAISTFVKPVPGFDACLNEVEQSQNLRYSRLCSKQANRKLRDREPSRINIRKIIRLLKCRKLRLKRKKMIKKTSSIFICLVWYFNKL